MTDVAKYSAERTRVHFHTAVRFTPQAPHMQP